MVGVPGPSNHRHIGGQGQEGDAWQAGMRRHPHASCHTVSSDRVVPGTSPNHDCTQAHGLHAQRLAGRALAAAEHTQQHCACAQEKDDSSVLQG